ncbi:hypothetical protein [Micromonospora sp. HUAS LYJ1]|uniref:hypothetical protein n=1 Tax=Micromonospora sp. HUAS LYJ1 TaxID=3061626 RepID=UPI002670F7FE|nr:hypothetical protein [Micromonospora sp. HUAS LYJ1]WKU03932.1 hypothetical protein Q2K16_24295 [Micromonospora sp. HUAS LYJ1]
MSTVVERPVVMVPPRRRAAGWWLPPWLTPTRSRPAASDRADGQADADTEPQAHLWGYALRREWPDGTHDLFGFTPRADVALRRLDRDRGYWRTGPVRPVAVYLVPVHAADVTTHPVRDCRKASCPDAPRRGRR